MTAQIIPFDTKQVERKCSFCKATEKSVNILIKSGLNDHCICGECIKKTKQLISNKEVLS